MPTKAPTWDETESIGPSWDQSEPIGPSWDETTDVSVAEFIDPNARQTLNPQAAIAGGPRVSLPDAKTATASFFGEVGGGFRNVVTHEGVEIPKLEITPEAVQTALDATRAAWEYETSGQIPPTTQTAPTPPTASAKVISGGLEGVEELTHGVANFFTSGPGVIQLGAAATPLAPAVYAKWALDMLNAGFTSAEEAWDAFQKSDWRGASKNTAIAFGSFLGAGAAGRHGYKELTPLIDAVPRGDLRDVKVEEAQRKALEATMPREVETLRESGAPETARVVEEISREQAESGLREVVPFDETTDIRKSPVDVSQLGGERTNEKIQTIQKEEVVSESPASTAASPEVKAEAVELPAASATQPELVGMGGAVPSEFKPSPQPEHSHD